MLGSKKTYKVTAKHEKRSIKEKTPDKINIQNENINEKHPSHLKSPKLHKTDGANKSSEVF